MTLTEFLLARIAEDETEANVMLRQYREGGDVASRRWRRVLAECEAKRRIVERHKARRASDDSMTVCLGCGDEAPCSDLRDLASIYADHPDCDEAWRP